MFKSDFEKYANSRGVNSLLFNDYVNAGYQCPNVIETTPMHGTAIDIFSRLMAERVIFLGTEVSPESCNIITSQLLYLDSIGETDINIYINTPGGDVYSGMCLYDTMQYIKPDVSTICASMAASMGSIILCGGTAGKRFALPHSRVMIHQPMSGTGPHTQASDIDITCKQINKLKNELYEVISKHSGQPIDKILADADRDYWMTAQEAKKYGMIDDVLTSKK